MLTVEVGQSSGHPPYISRAHASPTFHCFAVVVILVAVLEAQLLSALLAVVGVNGAKLLLAGADRTPECTQVRGSSVLGSARAVLAHPHCTLLSCALWPSGRGRSQCCWCADRIRGWHPDPGPASLPGHTGGTRSLRTPCHLPWCTGGPRRSGAAGKDYVAAGLGWVVRAGWRIRR